MCTQNEALQILDRVYDRCAKIIPVKDAYLYGSYSRGDYVEGSDVDIFVLSPLPREQVHAHLWDFARISSDLSLDYDVTVSLTVRSEEEFNPAVIPYYRNVLKDGIRCKAAIA